MALKKKLIRKWRKNTYRHAIIVKEEILNKDDDGTYLPRKQWGYCINAVVNGYRICSPDDSWYSAWQGMNACVKWAISQPCFDNGPGKIIDQINQELQSK